MLILPLRAWTWGNSGIASYTLAAAKDFVIKGNLGSYFKLSLVVSDELLDPIYRDLIE